MTTALVLTALLALLVLGLDRNHARAAQPGSRLAGSNDVDDRDLIRVVAELRAADRPAVREPRSTTARKAARVRPASAIR